MIFMFRLKFSHFMMVLSSIYLCWQLGEKFSRFQGWHGEWQIFETRSSKAKHPGRLTAGSPKNHWKLKSGKSSSTKLPSVWVPAVHFCGCFSQKLLVFCLWGREIVGCVFFSPNRNGELQICYVLCVFLGGGFKYCLFSPPPGEMIQFD